MFSLISYVVLNVSNFGIFDVNQYSMILRSTPGVLNGSCFMLNAVLRFYSEWNTLQLHYNMLITRIVFRLSRCMLGTVPVNLCVSFKVKIAAGSFELIFAFLAQARVKSKKEGKGKPSVHMNLIPCTAKGSRNVNKDFYFSEVEHTCGVVHGFFCPLLGNCLVCVLSLLQSNTTMPIGNHSIVST